jgi:bacteriocin-like protein
MADDTNEASESLEPEEDVLSDEELDTISGGRGGRGGRAMKRPEAPRPVESDEYA